MSGITRDTIEKWKGNRSRDGKTSLEYLSIAEKISSECESALSDNVSNNNSIGSMFMLKAKYGYSDQQPQQINLITQGSADPALIADRYRQAELPVIDDINSDK